mmetsp:Transcript_125631/g.363501  ORF Transcript_125631/g.363501 Transcript_125631/m.363501 type:complete len:207 (-) Transcript_125631:1033-1653(-)
MEYTSQRRLDTRDGCRKLRWLRRKRAQGKVLGNKGVRLRQAQTHRRCEGGRIPGARCGGPTLSPRGLQRKQSHGRSVGGVLFRAAVRERLRLVPDANAVQGELRQHRSDGVGVVFVQQHLPTQHLLGRHKLQIQRHLLAQREWVLVLLKLELDLRQLLHLVEDPLLGWGLLQHGEEREQVSPDLLDVVQPAIREIKRHIQEAEGAL